MENYVTTASLICEADLYVLVWRDVSNIFLILKKAIHGMIGLMRSHF